MNNLPDSFHVPTLACRRWIVSLISVLVVAGCGPREPNSQLVGHITYQGEPLANGLILLSNADLGVYMTAPILDGAYEIRSANRAIPPGSYQIAITPPLEEHPVGPILERPKKANLSSIPRRYQDEATSGCVVQLQQGENVYNLDMTP